MIPGIVKFGTRVICSDNLRIAGTGRECHTRAGRDDYHFTHRFDMGTPLDSYDWLLDMHHLPWVCIRGDGGLTHDSPSGRPLRQPVVRWGRAAAGQPGLRR